MNRQVDTPPSTRNPAAKPPGVARRRLRRFLRGWLRFLIAASAVGAALLAWAFVWEPSRLTTRVYELPLPRWPESCDGLRVAVAADLHVGSPHSGIEKLRRIVAAIEQLHPDLVLLPGDFVIQDVMGGSFVAPETIAATLAPLARGRPTFAVLGNHDWWHDGEHVARAFAQAGIPTLDDRAREVHLQPAGRAGCTFWLAGFGDFWSGDPQPALALAMVPYGAPLLAFTHNPDIFPELPDCCALVVAGHTHGGQVYLPLLGRLIVPSRYGQRYAVGPIVEGGRHYFVTPGLGTSILPVRFLVPPEVSLLVLRHQRDRSPR